MSIEQNHGYAEGCSGLSVTNKSPHYMHGYNDGQQYTNDHLMACKLSDHTDDNYLHYYIGFHDGAVAAIQANQNSTVYFSGSYPQGHTQEYDSGYKAGWNAQTNQLAYPGSKVIVENSTGNMTHSSTSFNPREN